MEKREPFYTVGGKVNLYSHHREQYGVSQKKIKIKLPYDPVIPLLGIYPDKTVNLKRYTHLYVHSSTIYNSQDMKAI